MVNENELDGASNGRNRERERESNSQDNSQIRRKKLKCEFYNDNFQSWKLYPIQKAQLVIADIPYCYDEETECWTRNGWKKYTDITYDDEVLSLNSTTLEMEYSGIQNIIVRDKEPEMVKFENKDIDLVVTKNHRMFACKKRIPQGHGIRNRKFTSTDNIRLAENVNGGWYIPRSGYTWKSNSDIEEFILPSCEAYKNKGESSKYIIEEKHIPLDVWLPFFGLWLADGCTQTGFRGENRSNTYSISIKQSNCRGQIVKEMMDKLPFKVCVYDAQDDKSSFSIHSKQLWLYLRQFGKSQDKYIPRWILDLPTDKLQLFWDWYIFGDSSKNGTGLNISTVSPKMIENLQEIALKLGTICQIRTQEYETWTHPLYKFQYNPNSKNITYGSKAIIKGSGNHVWCLTLKTNSVFLVRRHGKIAFCGNCVAQDFYGSNPTWYNGGDRKNGESKLAGKAAFYSDYNFNIAEYFHFCNQLLRKEPTKSNGRGRSSDAPCMIIFCSFEQQSAVIELAKKHGFQHYIPLTFIKNYSPQVLKANMRVVGATEHALVLYRDKLPKFRNGLQIDENGKNIRGTGHMIFDWFTWERDNPKEYPKIHPTQKPVGLLKQLIEIFTDEGDTVIDPCAGSGSTLRAAWELNRNSFGFEISKNVYKDAMDKMLRGCTEKYIEIKK